MEFLGENGSLTIKPKNDFVVWLKYTGALSCIFVLFLKLSELFFEFQILPVSLGQIAFPVICSTVGLMVFQIGKSINWFISLSSGFVISTIILVLISPHLFHYFGQIFSAVAGTILFLGAFHRFSMRASKSGSAGSSELD